MKMGDVVDTYKNKEKETYWEIIRVCEKYSIPFDLKVKTINIHIEKRNGCIINFRKENIVRIDLKPSLEARYTSVNPDWYIIKDKKYVEDPKIINPTPFVTIECLEAFLYELWFLTAFPIDEENAREKINQKIDYLSDTDLKEISINSGKDKPVKNSISISDYERNIYVREYTLRRAEGICQLCGAEAPFIKHDGKPYLECHHVIWLSKGGADTIYNTVALCPNCHRKMHYLNEEKDVELLLDKCKRD